MVPPLRPLTLRRLCGWIGAGLLIALCCQLTVYVADYRALRKAGWLSPEYPLEYVNRALGMDQQLVLTRMTRGDFGNGYYELEPIAELRDGQVNSLLSNNHPEKAKQQQLMSLYAPLLKLEFRNKRNNISDEEGYFNGALTAPTCEAGLRALLLRDTGIGDWNVTGGQGHYYKFDLGHGVKATGSIHGADGDLLVRKLKEAKGLFLREWDLLRGFEEFERMGLTRPSAGARGVSLSTEGPEESKSFRVWQLILEEGRIQVMYADGYSDG